jgi:hypothetical protein
MKGERIQGLAEFHLVRDEGCVTLERHVDVAGDFERVKGGAGPSAVRGNVLAAGLVDAECAGHENSDYLHEMDITVTRSCHPASRSYSLRKIIWGCN